MLACPAAVLFKQFGRQLIVFQADHRLHTRSNAGIQHPVKVRGIFLIHNHVLVVGEETGPVQRSAVALQANGLHEVHILLITLIEISGYRRAVAIVPGSGVLFIPQIHVGILVVFFPDPALGLPGTGCRTEEKSFGKSHSSLHWCKTSVGELENGKVPPSKFAGRHFVHQTGSAGVCAAG